MGWGPDAGVKGRVSEEALELAGVDHSFENAGRALETHRCGPWATSEEGQNQTHAHGAPDSKPRPGPHG